MIQLLNQEIKHPETHFVLILTTTAITFNVF
jgi:hypothetical protein